MANALMLPTDAAASDEAQSLGGLPGLWVPGVAYLPSALGLTEADARRLTDEVASPLVWVEVAEGESAFPTLGVQAPSGLTRVEADRTREALAGKDQKLLTAEDGHLIASGTESVAAPAPGWVEQDRARATALSLGQAIPSPHETNQREAVASMTKSQLETAAEEAGIARASTMSKATLVERLSAAYFDPAAEPLGDASEAAMEADTDAGTAEDEEAGD